MLRLSKTRFYLVPILMRTLDVVEFLVQSEIPLKTNEIASSTKIPKATTYRILRTLVHRGYVLQDVEGRFCIRKSAEQGTALHRIADCPTLDNLNSARTNLSGEQVIEIVHNVLHNLTHYNDVNLVHRIPAGRSRRSDESRAN